MTNEAPMVSVRGVHKSFDNPHVLRGVDLDIAPREVCVILSPSGSSKSTLLRCLSQLEEVNAGRVSVEGGLPGYREGAKGQLYELPDRVVISQRLRIGMVFQHFNLFPYKTIFENVMEAPVRIVRVEKVTAKACTLESLKQVDLADRTDHHPSELSGGQRQRVAVTRALAVDPEIMLFDEPTSAPNPKFVGEVLQVMKDLAASGMTIAVATHEVGPAREVTDTVVFMDEGQTVEMSSPAQVIDDPQEKRTRELFSKVL